MVKEKEVKIKVTVLDANAQIDVSEIVSNKMNHRSPAKGCSDMGYGAFSTVKDDAGESNKPTLISLALSDDANKRAEFVKLIEKCDPDIAEHAENARTLGQLQAIRVRPVDGGYDTIFGARRVLQRMYLVCKYGESPKINACIVECDDLSARAAAMSENTARKNPDVIEAGKYYEELRKKEGLTYQQIAEVVGENWQTVRRSSKIATSPKLSTEQKEKISRGEMGVVKAYEIATEKKSSPTAPATANNGKGTDGKGGRRVAPSLAQYEEWYSTDSILHEKVREFIALRILQCEYLKYEDFQKKVKESSKDDGETKEKKKKAHAS